MSFLKNFSLYEIIDSDTLIKQAIKFYPIRIPHTKNCKYENNITFIEYCYSTKDQTYELILEIDINKDNFTEEEKNINKCAKQIILNRLYPKNTLKTVEPTLSIGEPFIIFSKLDYLLFKTFLYIALRNTITSNDPFYYDIIDTFIQSANKKQVQSCQISECKRNLQVLSQSITVPTKQQQTSQYKYQINMIRMDYNILTRQFELDIKLFTDDVLTSDANMRCMKTLYSDDILSLCTYSSISDPLQIHVYPLTHDLFASMTLIALHSIGYQKKDANFIIEKFMSYALVYSKSSNNKQDNNPPSYEEALRQ